MTGRRDVCRGINGKITHLVSARCDASRNPVAHSLGTVEKPSDSASCRAESRHGILANTSNFLKDNASRLRSMRHAMKAFPSFRYFVTFSTSPLLWVTYCATSVFLFGTTESKMSEGFGFAEGVGVRESKMQAVFRYEPR